MCQGYTLKLTAALLRVHLRPIRTWLRWYRQHGMVGIRQHRYGGRQGKPTFLIIEQ
jgi:hypothetical protein